VFDSVKLRADLERDEGYRATVYDDATSQPILPGSHVRGHPTIGIGWALDANPLSHERALVILAWHVDDKARELFAALPWSETLDEVRCRALVNMAFNLGVGGLLQFRKLLAALEGERWTEAAIEARDSSWFRQVGPRAERIAKAFETGTDEQLIA
jgi:lysozyme